MNKVQISKPRQQCPRSSDVLGRCQVLAASAILLSFPFNVDSVYLMHDFTLERKHLATSLSLSVSFSAVKCHDHVMSQTHEKNITNLRKINSLQFANKNNNLLL